MQQGLRQELNDGGFLLYDKDFAEKEKLQFDPDQTEHWPMRH